MATPASNGNTSYPTTIDTADTFGGSENRGSINLANWLSRFWAAIVALETKVGITAGSVSGSITYILSGVTSGDKAVSKTGTETLTNKTLTSPTLNTPTITSPSGLVKADVGLGNVDNTSDATKNSASVTLTNKTLTTPNIASIKGTLTADTDGATITFDKNVSDFHNVVLGGNRTLALSNMAAGDRIVLRLMQDGTGTRTVTWFTTIKWPAGAAPVLTATINKADVFGFLCTSAGNYDGYVIAQNI